MSKLNQPTAAYVQFWKLPQAVQAERLDTAEDVQALCRFWRGDPILSAWEEGFLTSLQQRIDASGGRCSISEREWIKFREIREKLDAEPAPDPDDC